ncbi:MAG: DUF5661 family protein [Dehalobacterium sp.]
MPENVHSHYYQGESNIIMGHRHSFSGETTKDPDYGMHIHYMSGYTSVDNGHMHYYSFITGPEIKTANGHIHYYMGYTFMDQSHFHLINGYTKPDNYYPKPKKHFTLDEAKEVGDYLGIDWSKIDVNQFRIGMDVELEHGRIDPHTNVTNDDPIITGKIALAHLNEFSDYYIWLAKMQEEAKKYWEEKKA